MRATKWRARGGRRAAGEAMEGSSARDGSQRQDSDDKLTTNERQQEDYLQTVKVHLEEALTKVRVTLFQINAAPG